MRLTVHQALGVGVRVYCLDKGEKIARHTDPFDHSTSVARGRTLVRHHLVEFEMIPHQSPAVMQANVEHEIEALEDGTVVINICPSR